MDNKEKPTWYVNKIKYGGEYQKNNIKRVDLKLHKNLDNDIIEFIDTLPNKQGFIKELIRSYIKNNK